MGYFLKNRLLQSGSTAVQLPSGTTAEQPANPLGGAIRFSNTTNRVEFYNGTTWVEVAYTGSTVYTVDNLGPGNGTTTIYTMTVSSAPANDPTQIQVYIDGVYQNPYTSYTVNGTTITFTSAPPLNSTIIVIHTSS